MARVAVPHAAVHAPHRRMSPAGTLWRHMTTDRERRAPGPPDDVRVRRLATRAHYDRQTIDAILDAGMVAHVASLRDGLPVIVPMLYARDGDWLLLHGSPAGGTFRRARAADVCVAVTLLDSLVLARSAFHHSVDYRSVVVLGRAESVDEGERARSLEILTERLVPGRSASLRPMTREEVRQTALMRLSLEHASAKVRTGPPVDEEADYDRPVWAGVVPVSTRFGEPRPDPRLRPDIPLPDGIRALVDRSVEERDLG
jgi:nitroimidazol reductase NimA-like FMN-containing flavoprotein (pyridoxamine 5'-phosphate oxidase superfamily)